MCIGSFKQQIALLASYLDSVDSTFCEKGHTTQQTSLRVRHHPTDKSQPFHPAPWPPAEVPAQGELPELCSAASAGQRLPDVGEQMLSLVVFLAYLVSWTTSSEV